ncbi:hypothetical protein D8M04_03780 [Oceanobacillus piezotolerans]|uniref:Uncharacterized protein n=1 Tax=Oceanobacillus piezotolerans TaxID=2448030 RepID=A0A498DBK0_9BACI|nr:hypothetical protein D8M04_03780 [Oceanobacillus piezotolerans]
MKNGRVPGFNYWKLSYRGKFIRTLWMIPIDVLTIIMLVILGAPLKITINISLVLFVTLIGQLVYTYVKWRTELNSW